MSNLTLWHLDDTEPRITLKPDQLGFSNELKPGGALLYGYPMYIEAARTAIPVFTWPIEYELRSQELWLRPMPRVASIESGVPEEAR